MLFFNGTWGPWGPENLPAYNMCGEDEILVDSEIEFAWQQHGNILYNCCRITIKEFCSPIALTYSLNIALAEVKQTQALNTRYLKKKLYSGAFCGPEICTPKSVQIHKKIALQKKCKPTFERIWYLKGLMWHRRLCLSALAPLDRTRFC